jgi:hypothetical protein
MDQRRFHLRNGAIWRATVSVGDHPLRTANPFIGHATAAGSSIVIGKAQPLLEAISGELR